MKRLTIILLLFVSIGISPIRPAEAGGTTRFYKILANVVRGLGFDLDQLLTKNLGLQVQSCVYTRTTKKKEKTFSYERFAPCLYQYLDEGLITEDFPGYVYASVFWPHDKEKKNPSKIKILWKPAVRGDKKFPWYRPDKKILSPFRNLKNHDVMITLEKPVLLSHFIKAEELRLVIGESQKDIKFAGLTIKTKETKSEESTFTKGQLKIYAEENEDEPFLTVDFKEENSIFSLEIGDTSFPALDELEELK